jgi:hypothetical protein
LSFDDADDSERMLEVKATGLGKFFWDRAKNQR